MGLEDWRIGGLGIRVGEGFELEIGDWKMDFLFWKNYFWEFNY